LNFTIVAPQKVWDYWRAHTARELVSIVANHAKRYPKTRLKQWTQEHLDNTLPQLKSLHGIDAADTLYDIVCWEVTEEIKSPGYEF
jgi:hypothetical protein